MTEEEIDACWEWLNSIDEPPYACSQFGTLMWSCVLMASSSEEFANDRPGSDRQKLMRKIAVAIWRAYPSPLLRGAIWCLQQIETADGTNVKDLQHPLWLLVSC